MNVSKLKSILVERGLNIETLAKKIGLSRSSMYRKLSSEEKLTVDDVQKIKGALNLSTSDVALIFLTNKSHIVRQMLGEEKTNQR